MADNPYAAPQSELVRARPELERVDGTGDFAIGRCLSDAWRMTTGNFGLLLGAGLAWIALVLGSAVTVVGYFILLPVFGWGAVQLLLNVADDRAAVSDIFAGFARYGTSLGRMLLFTIIMIVLTLGCESVMLIGQAMKSDPLQIAGSLIYIGLVLVVILPLYFAAFFMVDRDMPVLEALGTAFRAAKGRRLRMFLLGLVAGLVAIAGVLALGVGILFSIPMSYLLWVSAYRQMAGRPTPAPAAA